MCLVSLDRYFCYLHDKTHININELLLRLHHTKHFLLPPNFRINFDGFDLCCEKTNMALFLCIFE